MAEAFYGFLFGTTIMFIVMIATSIPIISFHCTNTEMTGNSPNRHEICTQWSKK